MSESNTPGIMRAEELHRSNIDTQAVDIDWTCADYDCAWEPVWPARYTDGEGAPIEDEPVHYCVECAEGWREDDLGTGTRTDGEGDVWDCDVCPDCGRAITTVLDPIERESLEPLASYYWPVQLPYSVCEASTAQAVLECGSVALISWNNGGYSIVLTGGGMDLSWDVCAAYIACGQLPPLALADLPSLAGYTPDRDVVAAMLRTCVETKRAVSSAEAHLGRFIDERQCRDCGALLAHPELGPDAGELCQKCGANYGI